MEIKLVQRYSSKLDTPEKVKEFNKFYNLEEARMNHEREMEIQYCIEEFMRTTF